MFITGKNFQYLVMLMKVLSDKWKQNKWSAAKKMGIVNVGSICDFLLFSSFFVIKPTI